MRMVARLSMIAVMTLGGSALAKPGDPSPKPCANPGVRDGARRTLHDATATPSGLTFCTGEDCWSMDAATTTITAIPAVTPAPPVSGEGPGKSPDGRATATATEATFCPSGPASCKKVTYKLAFEPQNGLYPMINAQGTLGGVVYAGLSEDGEPTYLLAYDLVAGKLIKQIKLKASRVAVFRSSFFYDNAFYSAKGKKLGKLAVATADLDPVTGTDLVALTDDKGGIVLQDTTTGKAHARIKLGKDIGIDQKVASPDGTRLYVITQAMTEGEVFVIDVAKNKVVAHATPPACAAGTARLR